MKKITAFELMTLDGCFSGPNGEVDWFMWDGDTDRETLKLLNDADCLLLGYKTYLLLSGYWPTSTEDDPTYVKRINEMRKIVVTNAPVPLIWNSEASPVQNEAESISEIKRLRERRSMLIPGSGSFLSPLMKYGLIDEYRIFLNPLVPGTGRTLFRGNREICA